MGHVARQNNEKWTIRVVQWYPRETTQSRERPQKCWIENIKEEVERNWFQIAQNRQKYPEVDRRAEKEQEDFFTFF